MFKQDKPKKGDIVGTAGYYYVKTDDDEETVASNKIESIDLDDYIGATGTIAETYVAFNQDDQPKPITLPKTSINILYNLIDLLNDKIFHLQNQINELEAKIDYIEEKLDRMI